MYKCIKSPFWVHTAGGISKEHIILHEQLIWVGKKQNKTKDFRVEALYKILKKTKKNKNLLSYG